MYTVAATIWSTDSASRASLLITDVVAHFQVALISCKTHAGAILLHVEFGSRVCTLAAFTAFTNTTNGTIGCALPPAVPNRALGARSGSVTCDDDAKVAFF